MTETLDPRSVRVRAALIDAATKLLSERTDDNLSVTEVASYAKVSRPTIYQHFGDMSSLVVSTAETLLEDMFGNIDETLDKRSSLDYVEDLLSMFISCVYEQRIFWKNVMYGASALPIAINTMKFLNDRMRDNVIGSRIASAGQAEADQRSAISAGLVWIVVEWLDTDFDGINEPNAFAKRLTNTLFNLAGVSA